MGSIEGLAFDAYGTLFDVLSVTSRCEQLFPGHGIALAQLWRTKQLQYTWLRSLMNRYRDFWQLTDDALGYATSALRLTLTAESRTELMDAYLTLAPFPDVMPALTALKEIGLRLAVLSNGTAQMLESAATSAGIRHLIDAIISVDDVGVFKPSGRVYRLAAERLNQDAIGFVSGNSWDVNGAGSAGLTAFWLRRTAAEPQEELGFPATSIIDSLTELPAAIRRVAASSRRSPDDAFS